MRKHPLDGEVPYVQTFSMTLEQYLAEKGRGSLACLADEVKTSRGYLSNIARGHRRPSVEMACRIETATHGAVKAWKLLGLSAPGTEKLA